MCSREQHGIKFGHEGDIIRQKARDLAQADGPNKEHSLYSGHTPRGGVKRNVNGDYLDNNKAGKDYIEARKLSVGQAMVVNRIFRYFEEVAAYRKRTGQDSAECLFLNYMRIKSQSLPCC